MNIDVRCYCGLYEVDFDEIRTGVMHEAEAKGFAFKLVEAASLLYSGLNEDELEDLCLLVLDSRE